MPERSTTESVRQGEVVVLRLGSAPFAGLAPQQALSALPQAHLADEQGWMATFEMEEGLRDSLLRHSEPGDWLVTYPYVPVLNILAERPSYQRKLYVDNATESPNFPYLAIAEFDQKRPAVVVINNRDINKTEFSRFKNWATPFYDHIAVNYVLAGTYLKEIEVFVRPDRIPGSSP